MHWKKIFAATLTMISLNVFGQDTWDLQRCIDYATEHNLQVNQQELTEKIAKNNYLQSKLAPLPVITANGNVGGNFGSTPVNTFNSTYVNQQLVSNSYSVNANLILFNGLRQINTVKENKLNYDATHYQTEATKNNVMLSITQAFLAIVQNQESLKSLEEQVKISASLASQAQTLLDAGTVPEGNVLRAQSQLAQDSLNLIISQNNLEYSLVNLALLLQVEPKGFNIIAPKVPDDVPALTAQGAEAVYQFALTNQPQIKGAELSLLAAGKAISIAKGFQSPTLSAFASLRTNYSSYKVPHYDTDNPLNPINQNPPMFADPYFDQLNHNFSQAIGLSLDINILNGWQVRTNIANAQVRYLQSKVSSQTVKDQLKQDIYRSYTDAKTSFQRYVAYQKAVATLQTTYDYAQNLFELGASNAVDYSTAKSNLVVAQVNMINAKFEYLFRLKVLDFYQGKPIKL